MTLLTNNVNALQANTDAILFKLCQLDATLAGLKGESMENTNPTMAGPAVPCSGHSEPRRLWEHPFPTYAAKGGVQAIPGALIVDLADLYKEAASPVKLTNVPPHVASLIMRARVTVDWPDMSVPKMTRAHWQGLADACKEWGGPVHVACMAGHGRTGTTLAILGCLTGAIPPEVDPVAYVRGLYCGQAVETARQLEYVASITGRTVNVGPSVHSRPSRSEAPTIHELDRLVGQPVTTSYNTRPAPILVKSGSECGVLGRAPKEGPGQRCGTERVPHVCGLIRTHPQGDHRCRYCRASFLGGDEGPVMAETVVADE